MTSPRHVDQDLPVLLADLYLAGSPDYRDDLVQRIATTRQRPAWTFPERWLPMVDIAAVKAPPSRFPLRTIGVLALIGVLIAAAAVFVGSQTSVDPAPPFGLARNGLIAFAEDGDIKAVDQATGEVSGLIVGPETDTDPRFSPDGRFVAFKRAVDASTANVVVASADGSGLSIITPEPLRWIRSFTFSPAGDRVLIEAEPGAGPSLALVGADGSDFRWLDTDGPAFGASFLAPTGESILFVRGHPNATGHAIMRLDLASGEITTLVAGVTYGEFIGAPTASPDGTRFVYSRWVSAGADGAEARHFTMATDGSGAPAKLATPPGICCEGLPAWSNDGTRIAMNRLYGTESTDYGVIAIVPVDVGGTGTEIRLPDSDDLVAVSWSPDDRYLLAGWVRDSGEIPLEHFMIDVEAGAIVPTTRETPGGASWQRMAP